MCRTLIISLALAGFVVPASHAQVKSEVTLQVGKYDLLRDEVLKHRGKVVLVDFWGDFCAPCKKAFPHTVELSRKFADKGLVVITVAVDAIDDNRKETESSLLSFLRKQNATFTNIWLDEPSEFWQKKFRSPTVPNLFVFDRQGKWTQLTEANLEPRVLDALVEELVKEK